MLKLIAFASFALRSVDAVSHPWDAGAAASPYRNGVYTGPFTQLTDSFLDVVDLSDGFGPEDKLNICQGQLVFVDLDIDGDWYAFDGANWTTGPITISTPCDGGAQLYPRTNGYTVGVATNAVTLQDRLLVVGGNDADVGNVFYSDDCGRSFACYSKPQPWVTTKYRSILHAPLLGFPVEQVFQGGGYTTAVSLGMYSSLDGGETWNRPECANITTCQLDCLALASTCTLGRANAPDTTGSCTTANPNWKACYLLPNVPVYTGALVADWDSLWVLMKPENTGRVWRLTADDLPTGWAITTATWGGYGRKVFIKGTVPGSGCWFSTDYVTQDTWAPSTPKTTTNSMNAFATAATLDGPWVDWNGIVTPPWAPRASAAVTTAWNTTSAWFASGMNFTQGVAGQPTYSDAYLIDAGVCLLASSNGQVCGGSTAGTPDLDTVSCSCMRAFRGDPFCGSCTLSAAYGVFPDCQLCPRMFGTPCGNGEDRGECDPVVGCKCNEALHFALNATSGNCDACLQGYFGLSCAACQPCSEHGSCDGSGTGSGTGACVCHPHWAGATCDACATGWAGVLCGTCATGYWGPACSSCPDCGSHGTCSGSGTTGGDGTCACAPGWAGALCDECAPGFWGPMCAECPDCGAHGSCSDSKDGNGKCVCSTGWTGAPCNNCTSGFWGPTCSACPNCGSHGVCSGSGTTRGDGTCICSGGWSGKACATPPPAPPSAASPSVNGGAIAGGIIGGLLGASIIALVVYVKFFRGGPQVAAALAATKGAASKALRTLSGKGSSGATFERAALIKKSPASAAGAAARFAPIGNSSL